MMHRSKGSGLTIFVVALVAISGPAEACRPPAAAKRLSDADLLRYAAAPFDKRKMMFKREVVGRHRGTLVVASHPCGDVCPAYTRRIVHYDVDVAACGRVGGVVADEFVPRGPAVMRQAFCKPAVLVQPTDKR
jgi:hypothetical protein